MSSIKEKIPAYSTWEIFYYTIRLLEQEHSESNIKHLAEIVNSENLSNIFVYTSTNDESYEQHEQMSQQYKSFTVWLLGRFFYLLTCEDLIGVHKILMDAQLKILHLISITEPYSYNDLISEYNKILKHLIYKNDTKIESFIPKNYQYLTQEMVLTGITIEINSRLKSDSLKEKLLVFLNDNLINQITSGSFNTNLYENLDVLIHIIKEDKLNLKINTFEIVKNIFENDIVLVELFSKEINRKFEIIFELLEQFCLEIFNFKVHLNEEEFEKFKNVLVSLLSQKYFIKFKKNISKILINKFQSEKFKNCYDLIKICYKLLDEKNINEDLDYFSKSIENQTIFIEKMKLKLHKDIFTYLNNLNNLEENNIKIFIPNISNTWKITLEMLIKKLQETNCPNKNCILKSNFEFINKLFNVLLKLKFEMLIFLKDKKFNIQIEFCKNSFFLQLISSVNQHITNCKIQLPKSFIKIVIILPMMLNENVHIYFHIVAYQYLTLFYKSSNDLPISLSGDVDKNEGKICLKLLYNNLAYYQENKEETLINLMNFIRVLSSEFVNELDEAVRYNIQMNCLKIVTEVYTKGNLNQQSTLYNNLNDIIYFTKSTDFIPKILTRLTPTISSNLTQEFLSSLICICFGNFIRITSIKENDENLTSRYICLDCTDYNESTAIEKIQKSKSDDEMVSFQSGIKFNINTQEILKILTKKFTSDLKHMFLISLPALSKHIQEFNQRKYVENWIQYIKIEDDLILKKYPFITYKVLKAIQESELIPNENKTEIINFFMEELFKYMKESMRSEKNYMQYPILQTIYWIVNLKSKVITLNSIKILLYYIMMPTSLYSEVAQDYYSFLAETQQTKPLLLYGKFRREICQYIADLCAINQPLAEYTLLESLENIPMVLGYSNVKDFLRTENTYLMPFFVSLIVLMPDVKKLILEAAKIIEVDVKELLANNYGGIFLYIFLNKDESTFKQCMLYVEQTTRFSGHVLRKRNLKTILNELLLNFNDKKSRVIHALLLLAKEDTDGQNITISHLPDYLQPRFLGVLQYFDTKLFSNKQVLLSLPKIFELMGPKRIVPFRLKIIAMLRTALSLNYGDYPQITCNVWNTFVRSCDVESLGSQLAAIFVSLIPLSESYPEKINEIFRYLVIENENVLKENICDLFFTLDFNIDEEIKIIIKKYTNVLDNDDLELQIEHLMKYLTHETNQVKVHALKYLKKIIEKNHKSLDQMILGYNGINPNIVELLDALMMGCREKDVSVKLACSECIGELGAIEPSHLPRKYTQAESFIFYITEDAFIVNSLNELIRTLQAEKNTKIMDRFALAIQEILKMYGISPDPNSPKHNLWNSFPQSHQELIAPFLSSRYTMGQPLEPVDVSPVYGSKLGANFQTWIYNWTVSMIMTVNTDKRTLLQVCLLSLMQDEKVLMHFLPHILLHSLLEGGRIVGKKWHDEFFAVINSMNVRKQLSDDLCNIRPLRGSQSVLKSQTEVSEKINQNRCVKVIFVLLDFLDRWIREFEWQKGASSRNDNNYKCIKTWMTGFCKLELAKCSFQTGEYSRALMYLEDYIAKNQEEFKHHYSFLSEIYAQLDEPDAVAGVAALRDTEPTLEERILALEVSGKLSDAAACYERIPFPSKFHHLKGLTQCYLDLDNVSTALNFLKGAIESQPEYSQQFLELQAEPLWRLSRWEELDNLIEKPELENSENWGVNIGKILLKFKKGDRIKFKEILNNLRLLQVESLGATSLEEGAYQHGYISIVNLHILNELEEIEKTMYALLIKPNDYKSVENIISKMSSDLELRLKVVQQSIKIIEPILCLRRVALNQAKEFIKEKIPQASNLINGLLGENWLLSARISRNAGIHQQAYTYLLKAEEYSPEKLFIEKAKLFWLKEEHEQALNILRRGIDKFLLNDSQIEKKKICAEAKLLIAEYNDIISNVDREMNITHYKEALDMNKQCEKSYVSLAQYYDKIFYSYSDEDKDLKASDIQIHMINYFSKSMLYGSNFIYQSMPRMLSIWFDYGTRLLDVTNIEIREERKQNLLRMTKLIDTCLERLPAYIFLTAFSQIISRICHPQKEVYIELKSIIIKLILQYPQQSMWMMMSVIKSSDPARSRRCAEILGDSRLKNPSIKTLLMDFTKLAEKLIELCNKELSYNVKVANINTLLRSLPRLLAKDDFSEIMIPTQKFRKLVLPNSSNLSNLSNYHHNPFPNHYAYIVGIEEEVVILNSMQRPRKIVLRGSDGKRYVQMLKPKDDLRKDFRLMEFNDIVNQLLSRDADSRHRRLNIRLYSVAPLNEECGMIEWIHDLVGLRVILINIYKQRELYVTGRELKEACCNLTDSLAKKREIFEKKLLPRHPPVLGDWFRKTFPDAQSWLTSRTAYIRTTAVMSMVGYILGLGDRHGENILLDSTCGDAIHVDFNCLFNKGETFEWPERVPFRLTHNMVAAMGPLGVEGTFRKSCACTLKVLRENKQTLMSIVTPFVYDPLVSWSRNVPVAANAGNSEQTNKEAVRSVKNIELRLEGIVRGRGKTMSIPLSVEGQSNNIIQEAMNVDNLCQMYIGWGAYL